MPNLAFEKLRGFARSSALVNKVVNNGDEYFLLSSKPARVKDFRGACVSIFETAIAPKKGVDILRLSV